MNTKHSRRNPQRLKKLTTITMTIRKRRDQSKQIAIVVLEGLKVSTENTGVAPLCMAVRELVNPDDEILVLTLLHVMAPSDPSSAAGAGDIGRQCNQSCETDPYVRFLHEEISQRKEIFLPLFRPFYYRCKSNGVKFQVKIAAGFRPKDIIIEEANNVKATWIVVDACFARHLNFRLSGTNCNLSLVSDNEEGMPNLCLQANEPPESSSARDITRNPKSPKLRKGSSLSSEVAYDVSGSLMIPPIISQESEDDQTIHQPRTKSEPSAETFGLKEEDNTSTKVEFLVGQAFELTWQVIEEITEGFKSRICNGQSSDCMSYYGYLKEQQSLVVVKKCRGDFSSILAAERRAALCLRHKNILTLLGYHQSDQGNILVFPLERGLTLDKLIWDLKEEQWELTFQDKLKIAIGIANGIRYMHEECTGGPIAHGRLQPGNVFLAYDLKPMISGFEHATWLQSRRELPSYNRYQVEDCLDHGSMVLIKSDIFSFGVLLLRLFCRKSMPQDDKSLIEWARPLLLDRAFHLLLDDESSDDLDMHDMFRVMAAARMCTMSKPISRPYISEVISILKGDDFCTIQSSPSETST